MQPSPEHYLQLARNHYAANKKFAKKLKKRPPKDLDQTCQQLTDQAFEKIDCLECGNCCRSLGPRLTDRDIDRLSAHLRIKPARFIEYYLKLDEDQDYVFNRMPCPFILPDNFCTVYAHRPRACRDFPHTDRKRIHQITDVVVKNTLICPVAYEVIEGLKARQHL